MFTKRFVKDAAERAIATMAQTLLAVLTVDGLGATIDWEHILTVALVAGLLSVLKSLIATQTGDSRSASLVGSQIDRGGDTR